MKPKDLQIGDTFKVRSNLRVEEPHLHFILTAPQGVPPTAIVVNMTTFESELLCEDPSLILDSSDHPDIDHKSYIWFAKAANIDIDRLVEAIDNGLATRKRRSSSELVTRIRTAFLKSDEVPRRLKTLMANALRAEQGR